MIERLFKDLVGRYDIRFIRYFSCTIFGMATMHQNVRMIVRYAEMLIVLSLREVNTKYVGTLGGVLWLFISPAATIMVFYIVFSVGFKVSGPSNTPFILWFTCGLVPWLFFSESVQSMTSSVISNSHFVKRTTFPSQILPLVYLFSSLFPHIIFTLILVLMLWIYGIGFLWERLAVFYFFVCNIVLVMGLGWLLSSVQVFYRDVGHGVQIILNFLFWGTPIVWSLDLLPASYHAWFFANPFIYIVDGYRGTLLFSEVFYPSFESGVYFWSVTSFCLFVGYWVFKRLRSEFVDVL